MIKNKRDYGCLSPKNNNNVINVAFACNRCYNKELLLIFLVLDIDHIDNVLLRI